MELTVKPRMESERFLSQTRAYLTTKLGLKIIQNASILSIHRMANTFNTEIYYDSYFHPLMEHLKIDRTPHCCRHTCISMLAEAGVDQTIIKKIVGHSGAMTLTEKVYTHFDVKELVNAINRI